MSYIKGKTKINAKYCLAIFILLWLISTPKVCGQNIALKSNLLYDLTSTINLGGEIRCDDTHTFNLSLHYNPWNFGSNKKMKQFTIQPEYRKWFGEAFMGSFIGIQAHYGIFNFGGIVPKDNRYQGKLAGVGISYGYQWMLSPQWNLEAGFSMGYARLNYKRYGQSEYAPLIEKSHYNYWGPTQLGISLIYFIQ